MNNKVKIAVLAVVFLITTAVVSFVSVVAIAGNSDKVFPGVLFKGADLGNMTREEAVQVVKNYTDTLRSTAVTVKFKEGSGTFRFSDVDFQPDISATVEKAWQIGRRGNFLAQWQERKNVAKKRIEVSLEFSFSQNKLKTILNDLTKGLRMMPKDAKIVLTPQDTVEIVSSTKGLGVDINDACSQVRGIIKDGLAAELEVKMVELTPAQTTEELKVLRINGVLAKYTTRFDARKVNRTYNIRVAAAALDGQIIKPGEVFSFNKVVGPRSQEAGYKMAKTILNNEFIDGLGGGVCQVSSTLYNTLLRADVDILQRSSHSLVVTYVPLGQDATVAYGGRDLKFKNTLPCAIVIKSYVAGSTLTFKLLGDTSLVKTVKVFNSIIKSYPFKIVYKEDPTLPAGKMKVEQKGAKGYVVTSRVAVYQGDQLVRKKPLTSSYYKPLDQVVLYGPGTKLPAGGSQLAEVPGRPGGTGQPAGSDTSPAPTAPPAPAVPPEPESPPATQPDTDTQETDPAGTTPSDTPLPPDYQPEPGVNQTSGE